jgi:uncharacterized protein YjdB
MTQTIPIGKHEVATPKAFDGATPPVDITATGSFALMSSNPAAVTVGPSTVSGNWQISAIAPGTAQITWTFTNPSGSVSTTDTINPPDPPVAITVSYGTPTA